MSSCVRCGSPAEHVYVAAKRIGRFSDEAVDVPMCHDCFMKYTPVFKRGNLVFKEHKNVRHTAFLIWYFSSVKATERLVSMIDRVANNRVVRRIVEGIPYVFGALGAIAVAVLVYGLVNALTMSPETRIRLREFYRAYPLGGTGLVGIDPFFPVLEFLVALFVTALVHEMSHALILRMYGYPVRRIGFVTFLVFPVGAYVEPPGRIEDRMERRALMQLGGAGVFANVVTAGISFAAFMLLMAGIVPLRPEALANLARMADHPLTFLAPPHMLAAFGFYTPLAAPEGWYTHAWLGDGYVLPMNLLFYVYFVNLWSGVLNCIPTFPLDGGLMVYSAIRDRFDQSTRGWVMFLLSLAMLGLMVTPILIQRLM